MKINIVTERPGWILHRCAVELKNRISTHEISINGEGESYDVEYYIPYWRYSPVTEKAPILIGFFTHGFNRATTYVGCFWEYVCMNRNMLDVLIRYTKPTLIRPGTDKLIQKPVFGVVGRTYGDGRKGENITSNLADKGNTIYSCGPGPWPGSSKTYTLEDRDKFYADINYLLIVAYDEGGPMPVLEALARNVPIIAPNVGWCWEFPCIRYGSGSHHSLDTVLSDLTHVPTWESWAEKHEQLFNDIENTK